MEADAVVNIHEAKTHLSRLLERVRSGQRITIARAGVPIADLVPHQERSVVYGELYLDYDDDDLRDSDDEVSRLLGSR